MPRGRTGSRARLVGNNQPGGMQTRRAEADRRPRGRRGREERGRWWPAASVRRPGRARPRSTLELGPGRASAPHREADGGRRGQEPPLSEVREAAFRPAPADSTTASNPDAKPPPPGWAMAAVTAWTRLLLQRSPWRVPPRRLRVRHDGATAARLEETPNHKRSTDGRIRCYMLSHLTLHKSNSQLTLQDVTCCQLGMRWSVFQLAAQDVKLPLPVDA